MEDRTRTRASPREATGRSRDRRLAPLFSCRPYSARGDFGKISSFRGIRASPGHKGHRSLTAAQAANEFTRNCVLGFRRKLVLSKQKRDTGFRKVLSRHFAYLDPYFCLGIPVPLLRYGERYALFISTGANADAAVREVKVRTTIQPRKEKQT